MNLVEMLGRAAKEKPNKVFLVSGEKKYTFKETEREAARLSAGFKKLGLKKGDRAAILLNNSPEFIFFYFAIIMLGAEVIPLNTFLRVDEVVYILNDAGVKVLVTSSEFNGILKDLSMNRMEKMEYLVGVDDLERENFIKYKDLLKDEKSGLSDINENDVAVIIYTSGTTGHPKGAMLTHRNLVSNVKGSTTVIDVTAKDKFIIFLPMFHAFSFTVCVLVPLNHMCKLAVIKSMQPFQRIIKTVIKERVSVFVAIPQIYTVLARKKFNKLFLKLFAFINPIRVCVSGAAPLSGEILKNFEERFRVPLIEGYGLSETSPVVSVNPLDKTRKAGSVGLPIPGVTVETDAGEGKIGEIKVKGPNVMKGYFNREKETRDVLKDGWIFTGDIGRIDEDGYIYILDRKKDLILVNGMNLYPREVEEVVYTHPAVEDVAIVGVADKSHGEIPVGVVKLKEGTALSDMDLKKFCKNRVANFKIPNRFEFWDELPRNGTGKILKREIRKILKEKK